MTADTQGVLLRYAGGGKVYALPTADRHVWRVAGIEVHVGIVATRNGAEVIGLEATAGLAESAERRRRMAAEPATTRTSKSKRRVAAKGGR